MRANALPDAPQFNKPFGSCFLETVPPIPGLTITPHCLERLLRDTWLLLQQIDRINGCKTEIQKNGGLYSLIEERMYKYALRIAQEHKLVKSQEIEKRFYAIVDSIYDYCVMMARSDAVLDMDAIHRLHALIHPKGCRSHLEDKRGRIIRQVHQSGVIRKAVRYSDDLGARYVYVEPENIAEYLKVLITWYNSELQLHPLIKIMLFSLYFGACQGFCVNGFFGFS